MVLKSSLIDAFNELIAYLEFDGSNPFKINAYRKAISVIEEIDRIDNKDDFIKYLSSKKGIGKGILAKVEEFFEKGTFKELEALKKKYPEELFSLLKIPGLGVKRLRQLYDYFGVSSLRELEYLCRENRLTLLKGFGEKLQKKILENIEKIKKHENLILYGEGYYRFLELKRTLEKEGNLELYPAGKLFVGDEVLDSIDVIIVADSEKDINALKDKLSLPKIFSIKFFSNRKEALLYRFLNSWFYEQSKNFIGSILSSKKELLKEINEERDIFNILNIPYIPPELRDSERSFDFIKKGISPDLVSLEDIKGIIHIHTTYSDGKNSLEDMVRWAVDSGFEYIAISDHSQSARYANGLEPQRLKVQLEEVERLNSKYSPFKVFWGIESDILRDGSLDYDEETLKDFDFIIASIHQGLSPELDNTDRLVEAIKNRYTSIIGHPHGRLLLGRSGYKIDEGVFFEKALEYKRVIEINSHPARLDMDYKNIRKFGKGDNLYSISPDAHAVSEMDFIVFGVMVARKAFLSSESIINTKSKEELAEFFKWQKS